MQGAQTPFSAHRGVGRYTRELVREFVKLAKDRHEIFLVLNGAFGASVDAIRFLFRDLLPRSRVKCWQQYVSPTSGVSGNKWNQEVSELVREWYIEQLAPDIIWSTNLQEGFHEDAVTSVGKWPSQALKCSTLHDVTPLMYEEKYLGDPVMRDWYLKKLEYAKESDIILTVSNFSRNKIIEILGVTENRVHNTYNSYDEKKFNNTVTDEIDLEKFGIQNKYILYVGGADEHKNIFRLVRAYFLLIEDLRKEYSLVLVGKEVFSERESILLFARRCGGHEQNLIFPGHVDDGDLASLYRRASLFVFPSYSEGFGLPLLEAMACGCPVLAADATSLPEIVGLREAMFDPFDEKEMAHKIRLALTDDDFRERLIRNGLERASCFSWKASAEIVLRIFEENMGNSPRMRFVENGAPDEKELKDRLIESVAQITPEFEDRNLLALAQAIADSQIRRTQKVIYLDLSSLIHLEYISGIQRVALSLSKELMKHQFCNGFSVETVFSFPGDTFFYRTEKRDGRFFACPEDVRDESIVEFNDGDILVFLDLHPGNAISKRMGISRLRNMGIWVYFVVYDLLPVMYKDFFSRDMSEQFRRWLEVVITSDGAICISNHVRNCLRNWIDSSGSVPGELFEERIFHLGSDIEEKTALVATEKTKIPKEKYGERRFLMVGTLEPRKCHALVLDGFEKLWEKGVDVSLVIVGRAGWCNDEFIKRVRHHPLLDKRLFWLDRAADDKVIELYNNSDCLIAASRDEGFGLPLIEAAYHQLPIIARDIPVFREVAGDYAFYFSGESPEDFAGAVQKWLKLYEQGTHPASGGMPYLTWKESARQLLEIILPEN
jgi:glycosyltransferase involved in cell wall biosynthesis